MSMQTDRPRAHQPFPWQQIESRAERASSSLDAVFSLLDAHEDEEAERLLDIISDRLHSAGPR